MVSPLVSTRGTSSIPLIGKRVAFKGLNSDDERERTERGQRSRKERKAALKEKRKQRDRKNRELVTSTYNKLIDKEEEHRFVDAFNDSSALVEAQPEEQNNKAKRWEEARVAADEYLSRWKRMMNAFRVECEDTTTAKAALADFREKYANEEMKHLSAKKEATLRAFALCGVTKCYLREFRSKDSNTSSGDNSFDHRDVGKILERFPNSGPVAFTHGITLLFFGSSSNDTTDQHTISAEKKVKGFGADVLPNEVVPRQQTEDAKPAADPDNNEGGKSGGLGQRRTAQSRDSHGDGYTTKKQRTEK